MRAVVSVFFVALLAGSVFGQEVTIVMRNGDRVSGRLLDYQTRTYRVEVDGVTRTLAATAVARVEFAGPQPPAERAATPPNRTPVGEVLAQARSTGAIERILQDRFFAGDQEGRGVERTLIRTRGALEGENLRFTGTVVQGAAKQRGARFVKTKESTFEALIGPSGRLTWLRLSERSREKDSVLEGTVRGDVLRLGSKGTPGPKDVILVWPETKLPPLFAELVLPALHDQGLPAKLAFLTLQGGDRVLQIQPLASGGKPQARFTITGGFEPVVGELLMNRIIRIQGLPEGDVNWCTAERWQALLKTLRPSLEIERLELEAVIQERVGERVILSSRSPALKADAFYEVHLERPDGRGTNSRGTLRLRGTISTRGDRTVWSSELLDSWLVNEWLVPGKQVLLVRVEEGAAPQRGKAMRLNVFMEGVALEEAIRKIGAQVGKRMSVLGRVAKGIPVTVTFRDVHWREVLTRLSRGVGCKVVEHEGAFVVHLPAFREVQVSAGDIKTAAKGVVLLSLVSGKSVPFSDPASLARSDLWIEDVDGKPTLKLSALRRGARLVDPKLQSGRTLPEGLEWDLGQKGLLAQTGLVFAVRAGNGVAYRVRVLRVAGPGTPRLLDLRVVKDERGELRLRTSWELQLRITPYSE